MKRAAEKYRGIPLDVLERAHRTAMERCRAYQSQADAIAKAIKRAKRDARHNSKNK